MAFFNGLKGAKASTRSGYLNPGHMILRIDRVRKSTSQQDGLEQIHAEHTVLVQLSKEAPKFPNGTSAELNKAGQKTAHRFKGGTKQKDEMAAADYKAFLMGATGQAESAIGDEDGEAAVGPDQPLAGAFVEVNAVAGKTKVGAPFTYINYLRPVSAARVMELMAPEVRTAVFAAGELEALIEAEKTA
jgi:hypothetical protein